ncbi:oxidoreductase [Dictyobacter aurantiacus]|uniref:Oxidoreductase n=1 Tax=Dictyobacter aurantiacus TaxID=1936993 RepID=A0A401ZGA8_9CHLR|nr:NADH:flavin oxidoreductase/NADH oxidase [Dictyobacter aurantiacus]GCE05897.1 oxidoreductase [Dictyobacter aurantiacus]
MATLPINNTQNTASTEQEHDQSIVPLFQPYTLRGLTLRNRIAVAPMCQYSSTDGFASDWHLVHLGSFAVGGAAIVMTEATAVEARGRISPQDLGIYRDEHIEMLSRIASFIKSQGAIPAMQLAHAGRKASTFRPWSGSGEVKREDGGWETVGPSALRFSQNYPLPVELSQDEIAKVVQSFQTGARRALQAGFQILEIHAAHGYLIHEFLSPYSNHRTDEYGGSLQNRMRFLLEVTDAIRQVLPAELPLLARISASDWIEGGLTIEESIEISRALHEHGVDLIDVSSGGNVEKARIPVGPGYQVPFAEAIRREAHVPTGAVGLITEPRQANQILEQQQADLIFLAREFLRDPHFPLRAARELSQDIAWPKQYERAKL